jgi:hypothetical protein
MLYYMYHFDYFDEGRDTPPLLLDLKLFMLADKFFVEPLKAMARQKLFLRCKEDWHTEFFTDAIQLAYCPDETYPAEIKKIILDVVDDHAGDLFAEGNESFRKVVGTTSEFLLDYASYTAKKKSSAGAVPDPAGVKWFKCPGRTCRTYSSFFCVSNELPDKSKISCPLRCTYNKQMDFWAAHTA